MKLQIVVFLTAFLFTFLAWGKGDAGGSGGYTIRCSVGGGAERVALLDYFEAEQLTQPLVADLGAPTLAVSDKVSLALGRLARLDTKRAIIFQERANRFFEVDPFVDGPLGDTSDSGVTPPPNCHLQQLAIQRRPMFPHDRHYIIDRGLWSALDADSQAGLILHEIIYQDALEAGQPDSSRARHFNAVISSRGIESYSPDEYRRLADWAFATEIPVQFASGEFSFVASAGTRFSIHLSELLKNRTDTVEWFTSNDAPSWLRVDAELQVLEGIPAEPGSASFRLVARRGGSTAIARVRLRVIAAAHYSLSADNTSSPIASTLWGPKP